MAPIRAADAWQIILAARHAPPQAALELEGVTLAPDGAWRSARQVDDDAARLFDTLLPLACAGASCIIAQAGQSLDGCIATASGDSRYVTGPASRVHLHRLRALVDAVVVGVGTVLADDPALTVRHVAGPNPTRVVLDPHGRAPSTAHVFTHAEAPTWHAVCAPARAAGNARALVLEPSTPEKLARALVERLAQQGLRRLLVEGGGITISHFVATGLVDRLHLMVAPVLIGSGRRALQLPEIKRLADALRPACRTHALGDDRLYDLDLRHAAAVTAAAPTRPSGPP